MTVTGRDRAPLSLQQEHIWRSPNRRCHNIPPMVAQVGVPFDRGALSEAFDRVLDRHEILRTSFTENRHGAYQVVQTGVAIDLHVVDLSRFGPETVRRETLTLIRREGAAPFDLGAAPLIRAGIIRSATGTILWVILHHLVSDLWSMRLFLRDLNRLYPQRDRQEHLDPLPQQYSEYARWQRAWLQTDGWEAALGCWRERLARYRTLALPASAGEAPALSANGGVVSNLLTAELSAAVRALARSERATSFITLLTVFHILLWLYNGGDEIVVDTLVANRDRLECEPAIGMYAGTMAVRTSMHGNPDCRELIRRTRDDCFQVLAHQHLTFRKAEEILAQRHPALRIRRPQVLFSMQKSPVLVGDPSRLAIGDEPYPGLALYDNETVHRPLWDQTWQVWERRSGEFQIIARYARSLFARGTIARMFDDYRTLLASIVDRPMQTLGDLRRSAGVAMQGT